MRSFLLLACLGMSAIGLAGCTASSKGIDALGLDRLKPSTETTSSIPRPNAPVSAAAATAQAEIVSINEEMTTLADAGMPPVVPSALVGDDEPSAVEAMERVALVVPEKSKVAKAAVGPIHRHRFRDAKPINFGKLSPKNYAVHGVDVSRWQGDIDWPTLRTQGANFVYIKATDGGDHLDPMFKKNWREAHQAGLKRGAYHFFYWCRVASEQADWFIRNVPKVEGALPPVIDVEYNGQSSCKRRLLPEKRREKMQVFMDRLEAHYGQRPVIYTAPDFYADNLRGHFKNYPFWLRAVAEHPSKVYPGRDFVFWQYSGSGLSQGVKGKIDLNVFNGTEAQWRRWVGGQALVASQ
ncbi:GH25 family lysozyme [Mesorhizobium sp. YM1C-6-2]|uniref:glycoside hydrolase family 25 protein n=1 Tax=Mesorhizobium sp. YM1C-6-2 TaxID=1827501 RepID=UPI000EF22F92|nr:GH25 family lysozyme [Mesorhizobium sp. YM1C-6-2]RLP24926.1 glycosyl hydrolase [Mesorhizobium sp. YM1C-6-2]